MPPSQAAKRVDADERAGVPRASEGVFDASRGRARLARRAGALVRAPPLSPADADVFPCAVEQVPPGILKPDYADDGVPKLRPTGLPWVIEVKNAADIAGMREAGRVARYPTHCRASMLSPVTYCR